MIFMNCRAREKMSEMAYITHPFTEPLFLPLPANPPLSSTPANRPDFPTISPRNFNMPSKPRDSMRTLSPMSKVRPARLELLVNVSLVRLAGLSGGGLEAVVLCAVELIADEEEATEDARPATELRPDSGMYWVGGESESALSWLKRWPVGLLAFIASAKALEASTLR